MLPEHDRTRVVDMLDSARAAVEMCRGMTYDQFESDRKTRRAVEREIEIIGEAANKVSEATRAASADVPWRKIIAQRHVLAHEYGEIQDELIWKLVQARLPDLIQMLEPLLGETEESNNPQTEQ
jgi:uncharacterized protein with HEPN domain